MIRLKRVVFAALTASLLWSPLLIGSAGAADGQLDVTFGNAGKVTTDFVTSFDNAHAIAVQGDGRIVVAGTVFGSSAAPGSADFAVARYNSDGSLDASFGTGGKVQTDFATTSDNALGVAIQADGKIVVVGATSSSGNNADFGVVRYNADGTLDTTFGIGGKVTTDFGATFFEQATSVALQRDGKIVVAGFTFSFATGQDFALARYDANGALDPTFGTGGLVITNVSGSTAFDQATAVAIQSDGKIVATGIASPSTADGSNFAVVRYDSTGTLDPTFGTRGIVDIDFGNTQEVPHALALQADGKIVVAGESTPIFRPRFAVARYDIDGTPDAAFGVGGMATADIGPDTNGQAFGVGIQYDGKIVAAGTTFVQNSVDGSNFGVVRFDADGVLDTSFGTSGLTITDFNLGSDDGTAMAIQFDGKIVVAGSTTFGSAIGLADFAIARYDGPAPHTLAYFLHSTDTPGTAGGFTMDLTPPSSRRLLIEIGHTPRWFADPPVTGAFLSGATFRLVLPCVIGISLPKTVTLTSTDVNGGDVRPLGSATQGLVLCAGQPTISLPIPVATPTILINRRLRLTIATPGQAIILPLGSQTFLEATDLVGTP
jgi:uncharacterized delta-60 repeat protein